MFKKYSTVRRGTLVLLIGLFLCVAAGGVFAVTFSQNVKSGSVPPVTVAIWQNSSAEERSAFLFGMVSMIELEKEWQGNTSLPPTQSLNGLWVMGLNGVTLREMESAIQDYAVHNPQNPDTQIMEVLWFRFVQPKLSEKMKADVRAVFKRNLESGRKK